MPQKTERLQSIHVQQNNPLWIFKKFNGALRMSGAPVSSTVINAVATGIILAKDRTLLVENGDHLSLSND